MATVTIYTTDWCPYCHRAKALLEAKGVDYTEIDITCDAAGKQEMMDRSGRRTVPQIFIDGDPIGGCDDLYALEAKGELDQRLGRSG